LLAIVVFFFSLSPLPSYNPALRHSQTALIRARIHHQQNLQSVLADSKPKAAGAISQSAELFNESEMTVLSLAGERRKETESNEKHAPVALLLTLRDRTKKETQGNENRAPAALLLTFKDLVTELFKESENTTVLFLAGERRKETESNEKQMRVALLLSFKYPIAESSSRNCR